MYFEIYNNEPTLKSPSLWNIGRMEKLLLLKTRTGSNSNIPIFQHSNGFHHVKQKEHNHHQRRWISNEH